MIKNCLSHYNPVAASAIVPQTLSIKILEDITVYTFPAVDNHTLNITWQPPVAPNGYISHYNIDVINRKLDSIQYPSYNFSVSAVDGQEQYTLPVNNLG